jgi:tetratricopeptide (TPR) repeat protein
VNFSYQIPAALIGAAIVLAQTQSAVPQTVSEKAIAAMAKSVTVAINGQNPGSGAIVGKDGNTYKVITAKHVVATPDEYEIVTSDGTKHILRYSTVKKLPGIDLAVVEFTSEKNYPVAKMGSSEAATEGSSIYIAGWPHPGQAITQRIFQFTSGKISGRTLGAAEEGYELVYTNTTNSGMSGGPVFDEEGRLIGIHGRAEGEVIFNADTGNSVAVKSGFNLGIPIDVLYKQSDVTLLPKNPSLAEIQADRAVSSHKQKQIDQAFAYYEKLQAVSPNSWLANMNLGLIEYEKGNVDKAIQHWQKAAEIAPKAGEPKLATGVALYARGERERGLELSAEALQLENSSFIKDKNLSDYLWGSRLIEAAKAVAQNFSPLKNFEIAEFPWQHWAISPQGTVLATLQPEGSNGKPQDGIPLIDLVSGQEIRRLSKPPQTVKYKRYEGIIHDSVRPNQAISSDGKILAGVFSTNNGGGQDEENINLLKVWDLASGKDIHAIPFSLDSAESLAFSPDRKILAIGGEKAIQLWDVASGQEIRKLTGLPANTTTKSLAFTRNSQRLVSCHENGAVKVWNPSTGTELKAFSELAGAKCNISINAKGFDISPDDRTLAVAISPKKEDGDYIQLLDLSSGQEIRRLTWRNKRDMARCLTFSPDGKNLAAVIDNDCLLVWDVSSGRERQFFLANARGKDCKTLVFKTDGKTLTGIYESSGIFWHISNR